MVTVPMPMNLRSRLGRYEVVESGKNFTVIHCRHWTRGGADACAALRAVGVVHNRHRPLLQTANAWVRHR